MHKICSTCKIQKSTSEFYWYTPKNGIKKPMSRCISCDKAKSKTTPYKKRNRSREERRSWKLRRFSLTDQQFNSMLKSQKGVCLVCGGTDENKRLSVDHDHSCCPGNSSCGKCVRGLLCSRCNIGLGYFKDSIKLLNNAAVYLSNNTTKNGH